MKRAGALVLLATLTAVPLGLSLWALRHRAPCALPDGDVFNLKLELSGATAKPGKRYSLWTRSVLTNASCHDLRLVQAEPFCGSERSGGLTYSVRDSAGREVREAGPLGNAETEYGRRLPYSEDPSCFSRLRSDVELEMTGDGFVTMPPGKSLATSASVLDPRENLGWGPAPGSTGTFSEGMQVRKAPATGIPPPPAGFRILDRYIFKKPGRYSIRAVFEQKGIRVSPRYPYASRVPPAVKRLLDRLGLMRPGDSDRAYFDARPRDVRVESAPVEFEVRP